MLSYSTRNTLLHELTITHIAYLAINTVVLCCVVLSVICMPPVKILEVLPKL